MNTKILKYLALAVAKQLLTGHQAKLGLAVFLILSIQTALVFAQTPEQLIVATPDTAVPSDVENIKALAGDASISLTWDVATDNVAVTGYKVYYGTESVKSANQSYELPPVTVDDVVTTSITGLENGKIYYFALTALDAAGNESDRYSVEASAMPQAGLRSAAIENDGKNPEVKEAEAKTIDEVKVVFSEPIVLPLENPEKSFVILTTKDKNMGLEVKRAELDPSDEDGKAVILQTGQQTADEEYEITVGVEIQDHYGNAVVVSKETDTLRADKMKFNGFAPDNEKTAKDETPPDMVKITADENTKVSVTFTEPVELGDSPKSHFLIVKKSTETPLKIQTVTLSKDGKVAYLTTEKQEKTTYELRVSKVKDATGNEMADAKLDFEGNGPSLKDLISPEDITKLLARIVNPENHVVELTWQKSKNSAGDLVDQILYQSLNRGRNYNSGTSLGPDAENAEVKDLTPGRTYTFKITSKDASGNESKGVITSIRLPETGPALPLAFGISLLAGYLAKRKKRKMSLRIAIGE